MSRIAYRPEIDGLRAIAVLAVVLNHAGFGPDAGFVGVDIFFVISGYLITALLHTEWRDSGTMDLLAFYARRVRRLFPALVVVVTATVVAATLLLSPYGEIQDVSQSAAAALVFVANVYFQTGTGGYFDQPAEHFPLLHLWSLGVEEQFYLLWPLLLLGILRWRPKALGPLLAVLAVASLVLAERWIPNSPNLAFYAMPARFWELACGGFIALSAARPWARPAGRGLAWIGLALVLFSTLFHLPHFPGLGAAPAVLGSALLLLAIHGEADLHGAGWLLRSPPMRFFGLISYSLYLWHWPLLAIARTLHVGPPSIALRCALVALAVLLAWLSYRYVESPLRRRNPQTSDRSLVASGLLLSSALAAFALVLGNSLNTSPPPKRSAASLQAEAVRADMPANIYHCHYPLLDPLSAFPRPHCESEPDKPVRVVIWGDSYASAWQPLAFALAKEQGVAGLSYARSSCPPVLGFAPPTRNGSGDQLCLGFNDLVASRLGDVDTLILAARWYDHPDGKADLRTTEFGRLLAATVARVLPRVKHLLLLGPTPALRDTAPKCIERENLDACAVARSDYIEQAKSTRQLLQSIAATDAKIEYVDMDDFFCNATTCPVMKDGYSLYWDEHHVSSTAAEHFAAQYLAARKEAAHTH